MPKPDKLAGQTLLRSFKRTAAKHRGSLLPAVVFITGACVLVIEVVATRILSPFYGNTIFSYSSILGIVLAALSVGYYCGGRLADRRPDSRLFYSIIALGGISVMLLHVLTIWLLPYLSHKLSIVAGPLVSSLALFFIPAVLLGTLSPFAIKLQQTSLPSKGIGTITGEMFFWSTMGSIAGSLVTGFVLIPLFGINHIVLGVGLVLLALGIIPLMFISADQRLRQLGVIVLVGALVFSIQTPVIADVLADRGIPNTRTVYSDDGLYERITIQDGTQDGRPTRFFVQDRSMSGAMYLDSDDLVYDYTKYYSLYKFFRPNLDQALVIGGGAYSVPKALLQEQPDSHVDVSEIEPSLHDLSQRFFKVPQTDRLANFTEDGRRLLAKTDKRYDLIFSDVYYSLYSIPSHFTTREFFELARDRLSPDGVFVANMIGSLSRKEPSLILSEMRTFQAAFPNSYFIATGSAASEALQNIMFVGSNSNKRPDLSIPPAGDDTQGIFGGLAARQVDPARFNLSRYPMLTDNYAPTEYFISSLLADQTHDLEPNGKRMLSLIEQQLSYQSRYLGGAGSRPLRDFIASEAEAAGAKIVRQAWQERDSNGKSYGLQNIIARLRPDLPRRIVVGAHYDSKAKAEKDSADTQAAVPGANDAGSGVAALLETIRVLSNHDKQQPIAVGVDFVFFDGEEGFPGEGVESGKWRPIGSEYFAGKLHDLYPEPNPLPEGGVVLDMVCDRNLTIYQENSSLQAAPQQVRRFWDIGSQLAPDVFKAPDGKAVVDDHTALNHAGIPSFLVIDPDYPPYHTQRDTADKCSSRSLKVVADTLLTYLRQL